MGLLGDLFRTKPKILVVDDDFHVRDLAVDVLSSQGYQVVAAADGLDALALLRNYRFSLVILDVRMPKMDGLEVLESIRALPGGKDQAVMMLTSEDLSSTINRAFELKAVDYILKPFSIKDLLGKVNAHFSPK